MYSKTTLHKLHIEQNFNISVSLNVSSATPYMLQTSTANPKSKTNIQISIKSVNVFYMLHRTMSMCAIYSFMQHIKEVTDPQPHPRF